MTTAVLVLNVGSSTLKFALHRLADLDLLCRGTMAARQDGSVSAVGPLAARLTRQSTPAGADPTSQVRWLLDAITATSPDLKLAVAGHRVVHGGASFADPVVIDDDVLAELVKLIPLAPAHQPYNLAVIEAVAAWSPQLLQIACFDTGFHRTQPRLAQIFPIPRSLTDEGLLRYGFHGLSYQHIAETLPTIAPEQANGRVIVAHLGHGASICAMRERRSVATTMGFTTLDGLMMGTRSGAIDPGLVLHLLRERGMAIDAVQDLLNNRSGLLGVSGLSDDVRELASSADLAAREALDLFAYRAAREVASLLAAVEGIDLLVFTGGIGENAATIRAAICTRLAWAGVELDAVRNREGQGCISVRSAPVAVHVVPANEELPIARAARALTEPAPRAV